MASKISICNQALASVPTSTIISVGDGTREANLCDLMYDTIVEEVISMAEWSNAVYRKKLARLDETPTFGFSYAYQLPMEPKIIKTLAVEGSNYRSIKYAKEGNKLLTDSNEVNLRYLGMITNSEEFGIYLTTAIIARLSHAMTLPITGDKTAEQISRQHYEAILQKNIIEDNQQGSNIQINSIGLIGSEGYYTYD